MAAPDKQPARQAAARVMPRLPVRRRDRLGWRSAMLLVVAASGVLWLAVVKAVKRIVE